MILKARSFEYCFPRPAMVMGIVNVTPDSFSDGGRYLDTEAAVAHALELNEQGADIIDIGGESTRPASRPVGVEEELSRVMPVVERLAGRVNIPISIDTQKPEVARAAVDAGASMVNDIGANRNDPAMAALVAESGVAYVAMHMQGSPQTMQRSPAYQDVVQEVTAFFEEQMRRLTQCGAESNQIVLDVGIGFGKNLEHNLQLLGNLRRFTPFQRPMLVGVSRKSFIGSLLGVDVEERLPGSLACACWGALEGMQIVRTHDVKETVGALRLIEALAARKK